MTEKEKYAQVRREAGFTGLALLALILFWLVAGFGAAQLDLEVCGLPLWIETSSLGVWTAAIVLVKLLTGFVFQDMDLDEQRAPDGRGAEPRG